MNERERQERARRRAEQLSKLWLVLGCGMLGVLSGLLIGLSVSPIANTALGLLLGFAGALFSLTKKSEPEVTRMGQTTFIFALFTLGGLVAGLFGRTHDLLKPASPPAQEARYVLDTPLSAAEVIELAKLSQEPEVVRRLILASPRRKVSLTATERKLLVEAQVHPAIILAMLEPEHPMNRLPLVVEKADFATDGGTPLPKEFFSNMLQESHSSEQGGSTRLYGSGSESGQNAEAADDLAAQYKRKP